MMPSLVHDDYTIAWVCALPLEGAAGRAVLDKIHDPLPQPSTDPNAYTLGELNGHHIVIACLPVGVYGTVSAATVISHLVSTFPRTRFALMVGIGGGVPSSDSDIRLGDVVVSKPGAKHSGVIQYDYGKATQGGHLEPTGTLNKPPSTLLSHMSHLEAKLMTTGCDSISAIVEDVLERNPTMKNKFSPLDEHADYLFRSSYHHVDTERNCDNCDKEQLISRPPRDQTPRIHYGLIASGDQVMKDSVTRDRLARQHSIICFEMEAAGLMDGFPTLVIRGICDYCDSHKQKEWQGYAALTAAGYAKMLLSVVPVSSINQDPGQSNRLGHWMVLLARNPQFVGRQDEIMKLEELLFMKDGPKRAAITGLGGVGKTQIALEIAYRIRDRDKERSVFWIPCTSYEIVEQTFLTVAQILKLPQVKPAEAKEQVKAFLSSESAGKWLLVFDNADDMEMWSAGDMALKDLLPQSEQGCILFTTRNRKVAMKLAPFNAISVPDEDKETAWKILENLLDKDLLTDHTTTTTLLEQLTFLPLAITQASAYIIENDISLVTYLALLQEQEAEVVDLLSEDFEDTGRYKEIQNPVITTWLISFKRIQDQDQLAADYLSFMACINPRNIPRSLLPSPQSKKQGVNALGLLSAYSFINGQDTDINMHRLVHIATRNWLRRNELFSHSIVEVADRIEALFPDPDHTNRELWREYLPHALAVMQENDFVIQQARYTHLIRKVADCLSSDGRYNEAELVYRELVQTMEKKYGPEHPATPTSMANLALTYWYQGRWYEAEQLQIQVLDIYKKILGAEHPNTLTTMANLAAIYRDQGHWDEAEQLEVQAVDMYKKILGVEHPSTLTTMGNLAATYRDQRRHDEAEQLDIQVLDMRKKIFGVEHPSTLNSMVNLAATYQDQGRWDEAEQLQVQAVDMYKEILGVEHPSTLTTMADLASTYLNQGHWDEAEQLQIQVLDMRKKILGVEHPSTLNSMASLTATYRDRGHWDEAEQLEIQVLDMSKKILRAEHPSILVSMGNLALTYANQGRWDEAEQLDMQVLETKKRKLGAEHPDTLQTMHDLAFIWKFQGKVHDALVLLKECSQMRNRVLGPNHPDTVSSFRTLSKWEEKYGLLPTETTIAISTRRENLEHIQEVSTGHTTPVLSHTQRRPALGPSLQNHPLIRALSRASIAPTTQDSPEVD